MSNKEPCTTEVLFPHARPKAEQRPRYQSQGLGRRLAKEPHRLKRHDPPRGRLKSLASMNPSSQHTSNDSDHQPQGGTSKGYQTKTPLTHMSMTRSLT
eukprot:1676491-Amphidinium_carterae.1